MSSTSLLAGGTTKTTATATNTTRSLFTLALGAWNLCVRLVVTAALLLVSPAAVVILLPVACMAVSACILCAIAARILLPFFVPPPDGAREPPSGMVREQKQDCMEVDRAEAPGGFYDDASSAEEGHRAEGPEQEHGLGSSSFDEGRRRRTTPGFLRGHRSNYSTFYDLLAFWRSMEGNKFRGDGPKLFLGEDPFHQVPRGSDGNLTRPTLAPHEASEKGFRQ